MLKKGRVQVYEVNSEGRETTLSIVEDGTILGEMALTGQSLSGLYVRALELLVIAVLKRRDLEHLILSNPEVGLRLVRFLSKRLRQAETRLGELTHKDVPARLAGQILKLVESEGVVIGENHYKVPTRYTQKQLATMIGCQRLAVNRALTKLQDSGSVELRRRYIHVLNLEALKSIFEAKRAVEHSPDGQK